MGEETQFAEGFETPTYEQWVATVEKALKGAPFDKKMFTKTYEGITLRPIYTRNDWPAADDPSGFPGGMPFTRGATAAGNRVHGWDVRQTYVHPDPAKANDILLNELNRGVTSIELQFDAAGRAGLDGDTDAAATLTGQAGMMLYSVDDLDRALVGVQLDMAPVAIKAGSSFLPAAAMMLALWHRRRVNKQTVRGALNADPLGALAAGGELSVPVATALAHLAELAKFTAANYPNVTAAQVDTSVYHDAGSTESQDLALSMATALIYLKAMTEAGLDVDSACRQILFTYSVGCDQFLSIAKLRAARKLWARVAQACGASESARAMRMHAVTSMRMMSRRDPWVNTLRTTVACFAAAVAGAQSITVRPFDSPLGVPDELARRIARNTNVILGEESSLTKVIDPGGGSWYIESRTDELARRAWAEFQDIEKVGGMISALTSGAVAEKIAEAYRQREANLAKRRDPVTGVSEFPNILEAPVTPAAVDLNAARAAAHERLETARGRDPNVVRKSLAALNANQVDVAAIVAVASAGATLGQLAQALGGEKITLAPLPSHHLAERFEAMRDAADAYKQAAGEFPKIFLANLGSIAQHTARATFAKNFFEVAGIQAISGEGAQDAASCVEAYKKSGAKIAILCSADPVYEQMVETVAPALKAAGCQYLFLAGNPGDKKDLYQRAGVDDFIFMGCDLLKATRSTLARLGVMQ